MKEGNRGKGRGRRDYVLRSISSSSLSSRIIFALGSSLTTARVLIFLVWSAYRRVESVSSSANNDTGVSVYAETVEIGGRGTAQEAEEGA